MAIEKMKLVSIIGKYEQLDATIQAYLDSGCFQPESSSQLLGNIKGFSHVDDENPYAAHLNRLTEILEMSGIKPVTVPHSGPTPDLKEIDRKMQILNERLGALQDQKAALAQKIEETKERIENMSHFEGLDVKLEEAFHSEFVKFRFGKLPAESYDKLKFYNSNPYVIYFPCSREDDFIWGMYVAPKNGANEVDSIFNSLFFERLRLPDAKGTPEQAIEDMKKELATYQANYDELSEIISEFNDLEMDDYLTLYTQLKRSYDAFEIRRYASKYGDSFMLVGWIPEDSITLFESYMDQVDAIEYSYSDPEDTKLIEPPIKLENPKPFRRFEYYVEMFGVPGYNEIDPTPFVAIAYTLLYGIMFADVGQGIILAIAGYLMYKLKGMKLGRILVPCGIAGSFFGLIFGSVFGFEHVLDPLYHAIGFAEKPIEVMDSINSILLMAVGLGVVMMIVAICLNIYCCFKRKNPGEAIFGENGFCGLIAYVSLICILLSLFVSQLANLLVVFVIALIVTLVLIMFKEPLMHMVNHKEKFKPESSMAEYVMQSFFEMFEALLSYVTNTVSFLRVGAFVLVHAGMMMVFFTLAEMMPNAILYWLMIVLGNVLVLVLEGLLVGVQSLRLMFYEMFSRFYHGDGKPYTPAKIGEYKE